MSSVFEPEVVKAVLKNRLKSVEGQRKFAKEWDARVVKRFNSWTSQIKTDLAPWYELQLKWAANVVTYCTYLIEEKASPLPVDFPVFGPRFLPPTYSHYMKRGAFSGITPPAGYLQALHILHPFFYPAQDLTRCPQCRGNTLQWNKGWTGGLPRRVHGSAGEEWAFGYQARCKACEGKDKEQQERARSHCFAMTSPAFWQNREHWQVPSDIPIFFHRSAFTRELYNLIIETRPSSTSGGLQEHIKQLHLLRYHKLHLDYIDHYEAARTELDSRTAPDLQGNRQGTLDTLFATAKKPPPTKPNDYMNPFVVSTTLPAFEHFESYDAFDSQGPWSSISDEMITEVYTSFHEKTRQSESSDYLKTLSAICISLDNTFKSAKKAAVVSSSKERTLLLKGGILTILNELNEIISWRLCETQSPKEAADMLKGLATRCEALGVRLPEMCIIDNCCTARGTLQGALPQLLVFNDIYHIIARYLATILNGAKNPARDTVATELGGALLKKRSKDGSGAEYFSKEDQERNLQAVYEKWAAKGNVWSAAASKVHSDQVAHARKGCLTRSRQDILSDGSRIEGSHKGWNSIMRSQPSGIVMFLALASDFVLRRNVRVASKGTDNTRRFITITARGSHHVRLVNYAAHRFNAAILIQKTASPAATLPVALPVLNKILTTEVFGVVSSSLAGAFFEETKTESSDPLGALAALEDEELGNSESAMQHLDVDPALLLIPQYQTIGPSSSAAPETQSHSGSLLDLEVVSEDIEMGEPDTLGDSAQESTILGKRQRDGEIDVQSVEHDFSQINDDASILPKSKIRREEVPQMIHTFFTRGAHEPPSSNQQRPSADESSQLLVSTMLSQVAAPLPVSTTGMTASQALFALTSGIEPASLKIGKGDEFFLFMDMRSEQQWASFGMNPSRWLDATRQYNTRLQEKNMMRSSSTGVTRFVSKSPRALMDMLGEVEATILKRIATGNYKSAKGNEEFWRKHCESVQLIKSEAPDGSITTATSTSTTGDQVTAKKPRKVPTCVRCKTLMYANGLKGAGNHKKSYCSDGVKQKALSILWPQPEGIFEKGTDFSPIKLLESIRSLCEHLSGNAIPDADLSMEDSALVDLLHTRLKAINRQMVFTLIDGLEMPKNVPDTLFVTIEGVRYLRVDCLSPQT